MQWLETLNRQQHSAATAGAGPVLIMAGPGTGKTKTLTSRIAYLLASGAAQPQEILALTFTKKAAEEMRQRVQLLAPEGAKATISTFHALCFELLGDIPAFIDNAHRLQVIKGLPRPAPLKRFSVRELGLQVSRSKNMAEDDPHLTAFTAAYDAELAAQGRIDFDDLLVRACDLLRNDPARREQLWQRYQHILVDEFQDTNSLQYELLSLLRGHDNVFVIGDPNQSIYGFRGASGSIFTQFADDFPEHIAITLTANYRSAPEIVQVANSIFSTDAPLEAQNGSGGRVRAVQVLNEHSEANWVVHEITTAIGGGTMDDAVSDDVRGTQRTLRDFAIIYRSRPAAVAVQKAIEASGLPYQVVGEGSPYEHPRIQALLALLRSEVSGQPAELEGFTSSEITAIYELLATDSSATPYKMATRFIEVLGFETTPTIRQFLNTLRRFKTVLEAVHYFGQISETGYYDPQADAITLMTIHASKGLEFPYVFLLGAEEGILPNAQANAEEERRLFYVAVTRAREALDITYTITRGGNPAETSRFVRVLDPRILPRLADPMLAADKERARKRALKRSQQSLF